MAISAANGRAGAAPSTSLTLLEVARQFIARKLGQRAADASLDELQRGLGGHDADARRREPGRPQLRVLPRDVLRRNRR